MDPRLRGNDAPFAAALGLSALPRLPPRARTRRLRPLGGALLGLALLENRLRGGLTLGGELGAIVTGPLEGGGARTVGAAEMRHHIARVKLVGAFGRLPIG